MKIMNLVVIGTFALAVTQARAETFTLDTRSADIPDKEFSLWTAIISGSKDDVENALKDGASAKAKFKLVNTRENEISILTDSKEYTALRLAIEKTPASIEVVSLLLEKDANPKETYRDSRFMSRNQKSKKSEGFFPSNMPARIVTPLEAAATDEVKALLNK